MSKVTHDSKRRVYLACRAIFSGDRALLRQQKKVRKEVDQRAKALRPLTSDLGMDRVIFILQDLLVRKIFESQLRAKMEFPDLFTSSPEQDMQREASEADAAKSVAEALEEIANDDSKTKGQVNGNDAEDMDDTITVNQDPVPGPSRQLEPELEVPPEEEPKYESDEIYTSQHMPTLYPTYLPYSAQHLILNGVQRLLEESFFAFAQQHNPALLESRGWDCAAAGELTKWTYIVLKPNAFPPETLGRVDLAILQQLCHSVSKIRHSAVHRLRIPARGLQDLCRSAQELASDVLGDHERASRIEDVSRELSSQVEGLEMGKSALANAVVEGLRDIRRRREELDREEIELVEGTIRWDRENGLLAGHMLESIVGNMFLGPLSEERSMGGEMFYMSGIGMDQGKMKEGKGKEKEEGHSMDSYEMRDMVMETRDGGGGGDGIAWDE